MDTLRSITKYLIENETNIAVKDEPSRWDKIKKHIKKNKNKYGAGIAAATNIAGNVLLWKTLHDMNKKINAKK